jgi:hypothetical protein
MEQAMGWREDLGHFDLGRLTFLGWLVFLLSIAAGVAAAVVVGTYWDSLFPPPPGSTPRKTGPGAFAGIGGALGFFFAARGLLHLAGVKIVRAKADRNNEPKRYPED